MATEIESLPNDVTELKRLVIVHAKIAEEKRRHADELGRIVDTLTQKLSEEKEKYAALQRLVFGAKSEKKAPYTNPKQELLFNEAEIFTDAPEKKAPTVTGAAHERKKSGRKPLPANLERNEIVHALSDEERACPACGRLRPEIGEERTEELRLIPAKAVVDVHVSGVILFPGQGHGNSPGVHHLLQHSLQEPSSGVLSDCHVQNAFLAVGAA